jgi:hypothetical protein
MHMIKRDKKISERNDQTFTVILWNIYYIGINFTIHDGTKNLELTLLAKKKKKENLEWT